MDRGTGMADAAEHGILQASSSVLDYVRMSNLVVKKARQGSPLQQIAKAIASQPYARNTNELKVRATGVLSRSFLNMAQCRVVADASSKSHSGSASAAPAQLARNFCR
jgi:hypothetical protein